MTSQDTYIATETYNAALDQLESIARTFDAAAPDMLRSVIMEVLGEGLGVWPMTVFTGAVALDKKLDFTVQFDLDYTVQLKGSN